MLSKRVFRQHGLGFCIHGMNSFTFKIWIACLTFTSGFLNVFSIRLFYLPVSHHTGNIGSLVRSLSAGNYRAFCYTGLVVFCFFAGSFFSGLIFHKQKFELKRRYGLFLMGFAAVFFMLFLITPFRILQVYVTACILGMQNGLFIYYDGIVVRTTHLTGSLTDAALALAASIRGNEPKKRFAGFYLINIGSFFCGGLTASHLSPALFLPAAALFYLAAGLFYFILRRKHQNHRKG